MHQPPPPGHGPENDHYPLQETQFSNNPGPINRSPFEDPYHEEQNQGAFDHQPLLNSHAGGYPPAPGTPATYPPSPGGSLPQYPSSPSTPGGAYPTYNPPSPNMHYGDAPRRQPRRYKTSKFSSFVLCT